MVSLRKDNVYSINQSQTSITNQRQWLFGNASLFNNNPHSLLRAHTRLFSCSLDNNTKPALKFKPVDVTLTISSNENLYLLVLYVISINNTMLNAFDNLIALGCLQNRSLTTSKDSRHLLQWSNLSRSSNIITYCVWVLHPLKYPL